MKMKRVIFLLAALNAPSATAALLLGDADKGGKLHTENCQGCHDTGVYTRADRRVKSVEGLMAQVEMCNSNLRRGLAKGQRDDLVKFLNDRYYKFK
jgi:hypothetical protein